MAKRIVKRYQLASFGPNGYPRLFGLKYKTLAEAVAAIRLLKAREICCIIDRELQVGIEYCNIKYIRDIENIKRMMLIHG